MSGQVTEEIVSNLIKSNLTHLKTFAELLNAEFTEEGHDESNREKFKEDVSKILDKFGSAEADFKKTVSSLALTKNELVNTSAILENEDCNPQILIKEVDNIINIFEGKAKTNEPEPAFEEFNENRILQVLERVEDILNEFNPLKFRDEEGDNEDDVENEMEEQKMLKILEQFQKKSMKKHDQSMAVNENDDDDNTMEVDTNEAVGEDDTTEEEDEIEDEQAGSSKNSQRPSICNEVAKKEMDKKLRKMWNEYQTGISNVESKSLKDIYVKKSSEVADVPFDHLTHYPRFSKSILESFSQEAVVVCGGKENYIDPFTKIAIHSPIRNKLCGHVYEKEAVLNVIKARKNMSCPNVGCAVKFTKYDLEEDDDLTDRVTQNLTQRNNSQQSTASANVSNAEYLDDSDNESD